MDAALFHEPRRRMIRLADGEMAALDFGDAAKPIDVVFLHGNGLNAMTYRSVLGPLSLSLRIVACDLRGHGASRLPADPQRRRRSWADFRDDVAALLEALDAGSVVLSGHSLGGTVALLAAARTPERVKGLVLFDPVILPRWAVFYAHMPWTAARGWRRLPMARAAARRRAVFDSTAEAFESYRGRGAFRTWPEMMLADYVAEAFRPRPDGRVELACDPAWEAANFAAQANDPYKALRAVEAPIDVYRAARNSTCGLRPRPGLAAPGGRLRMLTVPHTTHFLPMERPDIVRDALLDATDA